MTSDPDPRVERDAQSGDQSFENTIAHSWFGYTVRIRDVLPNAGFAKATLPSFAILFILIMFFIDPHQGGAEPISPSISAMFWAGVVIFYLAIYFKTLRLWWFLLAKTRVQRLYLQGPSALIVVILMFFGEIWIALLVESQLTFKMPAWHLYPFYFAAEQAFQLMFLSSIAFFKEQVEPSSAVPAHPPQTRFSDAGSGNESAFDQYVKIADQTFAIDQLLHVTSEGHYLSVVSVTGRRVIRNKMSEFICHLPPDVGFQVHRSHWVARRSIESFCLVIQAATVSTYDGQKLPIARARRKSFQRWVHKELPQKPAHVADDGICS